ncbi:MAG TPA: histidine--tRNA ligase [Candidatus Omnitrophica bacterium]|nr:MAG: histidine--tRNA ligase [Omnitrophica WOR_2 bacterium GWA2_63_20]OGX17999.1 MAG: histidine--tRNA ligase [Omnitrophica WOR_2 bacterium GWF2_63_9]OGX35232.1 MAG: histidine--tRNA ligase [Omnitrophica WOR_2 bacterium RIFCSPHIGHO2_02_FULL_63_39]OGX45077.1 MAG: histidine--tRNA ligase [Omnitrophica WOR_2 bacterium RIFCSPLOWO2_02_FULL_63_16]OGX48960.1 MAG: histidine--tRNA ligase [Omnitrophica WOR_2 bacterium RIFCSPLOWO2_12_FULL_63_16]HAM41894.1 histidine--tRNA ligase [Candidatus Omnitrophota ba
MGLQALRGTTDLLPDDLLRWSRVEHVARRLARLYGYQELRTPLIEDASLFLRSVGETTDIVQKEMFRFADRGGHEIVLRPEGTAAIVRAYLEHALHKTEGFVKWFYLGPMFRAERPQAGRYRQFHQYGVEAIGSSSAWVDVEVIVLCLAILRDCGVVKTTLWLSSMGCRDDQTQFAARLRLKLLPVRSKLCQTCQGRFDRNVFRVLDCKSPDCQAIVADLMASERGLRPGSFESLCESCLLHFDEVRQELRNAKIVFDDTKFFARGLDYYTRTVFEVRAEGLGAQDAVAAGGRYDHLVEDLGGPSVGAVGFAAGIERVLLAAGHQAQPLPAASRRGVYLAVTQSDLLGQGFQFLQQLRERGASGTMDYDSKSLKAQLREADKAHCRFVAILGASEMSQRAITLKDMEQGSQETIAFDAFVETLVQRTNASPSCH